MRHRFPKATWLLVLFLIAGKAYSQVDFTADVTSGCFPLTVHFTDDTPGATAWEWDFGNNNRSELQNPAAVFPAAGIYNITLKATVGESATSRTKSNFIVVHGYPEADFSFDKLSGCAPLSVKFSDKTSTASGIVTGWFWVFGDGATSQSANPTHVFEQPGNYTVSLKARNEFGCEETKNVESAITILGPKTKFTPDKPSVCALPAKFNLANQTTGDQPLTFTWNFGDGTTSTAKDPEHTYTQAGAFNVTLKAKDASGCEGSYQMTLNAGSEGGLDFTASSFKVCEGGSVEFEAVATDAIVSAQWAFGDGGTANTNDPQHIYGPFGSYNVTLTAQLLNHTCPSVITRKVEVAKPAVPSLTSTIDCEYNLKLTSTSENAKRVEWYVNGNPASTATSFISPIKTAGEQIIRLVAFDAADCSYELISPVVVPTNPVASFLPSVQQACSGKTLSGCAPFSIDFEGSVFGSDTNDIKWSFGDGTTSTSLNPTHVFTTAGLYQVSLTATNSKGCTGVATSFVIVSNTMPTADFVMDKTEACAGEIVTFTDTSKNADFWCWDFGDGNKAEGKNVVYKFPKPGVYTVTLTAKNAGCFDTRVVQNAIRIKDPFVNFTSQKSCADPFNVKLVNISQNFDAIEWDFGDGTKSTDIQVGSHRYADPGTYVMTLTGTNNTTRCTTIAYNTMIMQQVKADFEPDNPTPCKGAPITFTDKSDGAFTWEWSVGANNSADQNFTTTLKTPGDYTARLEVTDIDGCKSVKTEPVTVLDMEGDFRFFASSDCDEFKVRFQNDSKGTPPPTNWSWSFGDGTTSTSKDPTHIFDTPGKYNVILSVSNGQGTCTFLKTDAINFTIPIPDFVIAKSSFCIGEQVIVANTTKNAAIYEWDYGDGRRTDFVSPTITYDKTGSYDITLFARDVYGCEVKTTKPAFINVIKPTADFKVDNTTGACPPFTAHFEDTSFPDIEKREWQFGDGKSSVLPNPANIYLKPGDFNVTLQVTDKNGCTDTKTVNQFVRVGGPYGAFSTTGSNSCTNQTINFTATAVNTNTYRWDFGDGVVNDQKSSDANHSYTQTGSFTPSLLLIDPNGCQTVADGGTPIVIKDTTDVSFTISKRCIRPNEGVRFTGKHDTKDLITWNWLVDGVYVGSATDFEATIETPGLHVITGLASNQFNCLSHVYDTVRIQGPIELIPNVITPNSDGYNDVFRMIGLENSIWNIDILNRWGNTVYRRNDYKGNWDGEDQPTGVYYFVLRNALCEDKPYKGYISVHR